jgi:hypothetical protein
MVPIRQTGRKRFAIKTRPVCVRIGEYEDHNRQPVVVWCRTAPACRTSAHLRFTASLVAHLGLAPQLASTSVRVKLVLPTPLPQQHLGFRDEPWLRARRADGGVRRDTHA